MARLGGVQHREVVQRQRRLLRRQRNNRGGAQADEQTELWICADCQEDFCESHVVDLLDDHAELPICRECGDDICRACAVPGSITDPDVDAPSRCVCLACREEERAA